MRGLFSKLAAAGGLSLTLIAAPACSQSHETFRDLPPDDAAFAEAIAEAKTSLPQFWSRYDAKTPGYSDFLVKAGLTTVGGQGTEFIWMSVVERRGDKIVGRLENDPVHLGELKFGSTVEVTPDQIVDWSYTRGGLAYGHYTTRVTLPREAGAPKPADYGIADQPLEAGTN